ncbi:hypothetical protein GY21_18540 [Cryobacterium roopkundense]|uniref:4Fe-4S ferredoxin-type domain-containing protein n=1 Tax=Cryobacterium roopkundense TaxID=1001240 RepID=A0A099J3F2_9MICO|nr:hypothetical protein GY21_18540 [Cryobacterium roopkundense]
MDRVVRSENCTGCGLCALLDTGLDMTLDPAGFSRPARIGPSTADDDAARRFRAACPGIRVDAQRPAGARRHATLGPILQVWQAWATDPAVRFAGSSGGTLTALAAWLAETGEAAQVIGARAASDNPRRTVSVRIQSREEALASAGSRYAPTSSCAVGGAADADSAFIGKPCEVSALRALPSPKGSPPTEPPLLLSFFCAGTPSQNATDSLVEGLGVPRDEAVRDLWFRGHGWPGRFTVVRADGTTVDTSYENSWGTSLGPAVQWRCKICPDGVGESADVTAADLWRADDRGYPDFTPGPGVSALIARTIRGRDLVLRAAAAGILTVAPLDIDELAAVQPLQRTRRHTLAGRLVGTRLAGGRVPRFRGFALLRLAAPRLRETFRTLRGTYRRRRALRLHS